MTNVSVTRTIPLREFLRRWRALGGSVRQVRKGKTHARLQVVARNGTAVVKVDDVVTWLHIKHCLRQCGISQKEWLDT